MKQKSPHDSSRAAVHVIPVRAPDGIQYFSLGKVLPQHFEPNQVIYKLWYTRVSLIIKMYKQYREMEMRGSVGYRGYFVGVFILVCLDNPAATVNHVRGCVIFYAQSTFLLMHVAAVCKILLYPLIVNSSWKQSSCIMSLQAPWSLHVHDIRVFDTFLKKRHVFTHFWGFV